MGGCRRCSGEVLHCHGTVVRHDDGSWECSEHECAGEVIGHDFVLVCAEVWAGCCGGEGVASGVA